MTFKQFAYIAPGIFMIFSLMFIFIDMPLAAVGCLIYVNLFSYLYTHLK